ncbi:MAG: phosphohydrolase [Eubacteriales bacterium]|nr:phosphohydrolase [Eubacteriales bacterium]
MNNMNTFSGRKFNPMQIDLENICTEDIAHALSLLCRGGGHLKRFYSVGQHSLNCMKEAKARGLSERVQLACLLHDASEAYIADIIRPVKQYLSNYVQIESMIMSYIWEKYELEDLTDNEHNQWKQIDDDMLAYELKYLMNGESDRDIPILYSVPDISEKKWEIVQNDFIEALNELKIT